MSRIAETPGAAALPETPAARLQRERDATRALLGEGYAHDHIDQDELDRRLELAERAGSLAELHALTSELRPTATALVPLAAPALVTAPERIRVALGAVERVGAWRVAPRTRLQVLFGAASIDLRDAVLPPGDLEIEVHVIFGSLEIIVPPGWQIDNHCGSILASVEQDGGTRRTAGEARLLRLTGRVVFGSLDVLERLPGEGAIGAWQRRRGQKALAERPARSLPPGDK